MRLRLRFHPHWWRSGSWTTSNSWNSFQPISTCCDGKTLISNVGLLTGLASNGTVLFLFKRQIPNFWISAYSFHTPPRSALVSQSAARKQAWYNSGHFLPPWRNVSCELLPSRNSVDSLEDLVALLRNFWSTSSWHIMFMVISKGRNGSKMQTRRFINGFGGVSQIALNPLQSKSQIALFATVDTGSFLSETEEWVILVNWAHSNRPPRRKQTRICRHMVRTLRNI